MRPVLKIQVVLKTGAIILMWPVWKAVTIVSGSLEDWGHHINVPVVKMVTIVSGSLEDWCHYINVASLKDGDHCIKYSGRLGSSYQCGQS